MAAVEIPTGTAVPNGTAAPNGTASPAVDLAALTQKYTEEKEKRQRADGNAQYIEPRDLAVDPWVDHAALNAQPPNLSDGDSVKLLILGAGYGGLLFAIRFIEAGVCSASDVRLVDVAGGFGGTWYWNRYPGLMCDVESYTYMPLLEETGYVPKNRYSYGPELRQHADRVAAQWGLTDSGVFRSQIKSYEWDEEARRWIVTIEQSRGPDQEAVTMTVRSQYVVLANGVLNHPKSLKNLEAFEGPTFHTARWDYGVSGGSPEDPSLTGLSGKRVGIIGTGASAVQVVPQLAKWAKELYVFQRTPSSVGPRGQGPTSSQEWASKIATGPGWQRRRVENFVDVCAGVEGIGNLVGDGWTQLKAYKATIGGPHDKPIMPEDAPAHIAALLALDAPDGERIRGRVAEIVKDKDTAAKLKAWYPAWCKRPTFHDDYLPAFNLPHVHLVDTDGKGVEGSTATGLIANGGKEYPLDVVVLSTGYRPPGDKLAEPTAASDLVAVRGRGGLLLSDKWERQGPSTLHGVLSHDFPNMFFTGPLQAGATPNILYATDVLAIHSAAIVAGALARIGGSGGQGGAERLVVEPTVAAEEEYAMRIMSRAGYLAGMAVCTPGYSNNEGTMGATPEEQMKMARGAPWPTGIGEFNKFLEAWRVDGKLEGLEVTA